MNIEFMKTILIVLLVVALGLLLQDCYKIAKNRDAWESMAHKTFKFAGKCDSELKQMKGVQDE